MSCCSTPGCKAIRTYSGGSRKPFCSEHQRASAERAKLHEANDPHTINSSILEICLSFVESTEGEERQALLATIELLQSRELMRVPGDKDGVSALSLRVGIFSNLIATFEPLSGFTWGLQCIQDAEKL